jgi:uncharacterized membrane protein
LKSKSLKSFIIAGIAVWLPILVTFVVLRFIVDLMDSIFSLLPRAYQPTQLIGYHIPGLGIIFSLTIIIITGIIATNYFGQRLVKSGESLLARIPLVRSIYNAVKQVVNAILHTNSQAFRKVIMIEYPRKGVWSIGFLTGNCNEEVSKVTGEQMIAVFIPTTPNPTSGFLVMVPKIHSIELDMTVDEALKFIISLGVMQPNLPLETEERL